jgi:hypothetical protein
MRREGIAFRCENVPTVARGCSNGVRGARMDSKTSVVRGPPRGCGTRNHIGASLCM